MLTDWSPFCRFDDIAVNEGRCPPPGAAARERAEAQAEEALAEELAAMAAHFRQPAADKDERAQLRVEDEL